MSGPVTPPLEVTEVDGSPDGRPITKIIVSNGDLTISGRTATIDTSGSATVPGLPVKSVQFNSDPAGTFTGSDRLLFESALDLGRLEMSTGATTTQSEIRAMGGRGLQIHSSDSTGGTSAVRNAIVLYGEDDAGDGIILRPVTGQNVNIGEGGLSTSGSTDDLVLSTYDNYSEGPVITITAGANGGVIIQNDGTGVTEIQNRDTNVDSILSILGNGTGDAIIDLKNDSNRVLVLCDTHKELKIQGGAGFGETFVFDVSSATGGITFPDGTTLVSAEGTAILSTGETGGSKVLTEDGDGTCSWQAGGGGGGNEFNGELTQYDWDGDGDAIRVFALGPYGTTDRAILATSVQSEEIGFFAFVAPNSGVISSCDFYIFGDSGASGAINVGFYADNEGVPETFLGEFVMPTTSDGQITQTVSSGGTMGSSITTVRGTQYWIAFFADNTASTPTFGTIELVANGSGPFATSTYGSAAVWNCIFRTGSSGNATITDYTVLGPVSLDPINLGVKW